MKKIVLLMWCLSISILQAKIQDDIEPQRSVGQEVCHCIMLCAGGIATIKYFHMIHKIIRKCFHHSTKACNIKNDSDNNNVVLSKRDKSNEPQIIVINTEVSSKQKKEVGKIIETWPNLSDGKERELRIGDQKATVRDIYFDNLRININNQDLSTIERKLNDYPEFILLVELLARQHKCCIEVTTHGPRGCLNSRCVSGQWDKVDEKCYCYR